MPRGRAAPEPPGPPGRSPPPEGAGAAGAPLRHPVFRAVWIANVTSNMGSVIQSVGASWMMTSLTSSTQMIALVQACTSLPFMLLALFAGAIADNLDRRRVMLVAQVFMLGLSLALATSATAGFVTPALLLAFTFLIGCGTALNGPAWQASVGDIVPRAMLPGAVALNSMGFNIARSLGPAVGGSTISRHGSTMSATIDAGRSTTSRSMRSLPGSARGSGRCGCAG